MLVRALRANLGVLCVKNRLFNAEDAKVFAEAAVRHTPIEFGLCSSSPTNELA